MVPDYCVLHEFHQDQDNFQDLNTTEGGIGNAPGFARFQNPFTNPSMEPESPNVIDTPSEQGLAGIYNSTVNPNSNTEFHSAMNQWIIDVKCPFYEDFLKLFEKDLNLF